MLERPTVGLALGSGGARGFAHIGVIKTLMDENIPIDYIAGSSIGAMIGCFYGAGLNIERLYQLSKVFKRKYFLDFTIPKMGFIDGNRIKDFIRLFTFGKNLEQLDIPVHVVATELKTGKKVVFKEGPIDEAVRASISIPGIFVPVKINGKLLVDGGVADRIPVSVVKEMGADIVIAVDVSGVSKSYEIDSIFDVIMQCIDILQLEIVENRAISSDVMIRPPVEKYNSKTFTHLDEIIALGEQEAQKHIGQIRQLLAKWKESTS